MRKQVGWAINASTAVVERETEREDGVVTNLFHHDSHPSDLMTMLVDRAVARANVSPSRTVAGSRIRRVLKKYEK